MGVRELHDKLKSKECGAYLGINSETGEPGFAPYRANNIALIGPPGSGKSTKILAQSIAPFPGVVIATTCRGVGAMNPDIIQLTKKAREEIAEYQGGRVVELRVDGAIQPIADPVAWNMIEGCEDWYIAEKRARTMAFATISDPNGINHQRYFIDNVTKALASLLFYHAKMKRGYKELRNTILDEGNNEGIERKLRSIRDGFQAQKESGLYQNVIRSLNSLLGVHPEIKNSIISQLRDVVAVIPDFGHEEITMDDLLHGHSTIYIQASANSAQAQRSAPIIAAFIEMATDRYINMDKDKKANAMLLALDEVASVAPIQDLPNILATGGGNKIQTMIALQNTRSVSARWPGEPIVENCTQVLFSGLTDVDYLAKVSRLLGEYTDIGLVYEPPLETFGIPEKYVIHYLKELHKNEDENGHMDYMLGAREYFDIEYEKYLMNKGIEWKQFKKVVDETTTRNITYRLPRYSVADLSNFPQDSIYIITGGEVEMRKVTNHWENDYWGSIIFKANENR